jgi:zinc protease
MTPGTSHPTTTTALTAGVKKFVLDNGLTVLTKEVRTAPVVSAQVWYRVGSRNEAPGLNGISHQLEHLMFKGTQERPIQFGRLFSVLGSSFNAFTSYDMTAYFGTVSQNKLDALLMLEADRMLNTTISAEHLSSEKRVVVSELQGYENSPEYRLTRAVMQAAFPDSAYGLPVGGTKSDVENFSLAAVQDYYQQFYSPDNAVLVVTGDFDTAGVHSQVTEIFGKLPRRGMLAVDAQPKVKFAAAIANPQPIVLREPGSAPFLEMVYPLPDVLHPDAPVLEVLDAVLSAGRSSRLYQALVESGLASSMSAYAATLLDHGWYSIGAIAAPGQDLSEIDRVILQTLESVRQEPISAEELNRAKIQLKANFILRNRDIDHQASQLAYDQLITGDYQHSDRYLAAIEQVNPKRLQQVAQQYLNPHQRTLGRFEPTQIDGEDVGGGVGMQTHEDFSPGEPVDPAEVAQYLPPFSEQVSSNSQKLPQRLTLSNGLRVLLLPDTSTPTVTLSGHIAAGTCFDPATKAGVADLTAENLLNGTTQHTALELATTLEDRGAGLDFNAFREGVDIDGYALSGDLPILLATLAEVLQQATFPAEELEISRQQALSDLQIELDDPARLGRRVFQALIYPEGNPFVSFPTLETLQGITQADIVAFYQQHYLPTTAILSLVGDFDPVVVRSQLEATLGTWQASAEPTALAFPVPNLPAGMVYQNAVLPSKSQAITYLGYPGIDRQDPRFYAALVMNQILGGDTLSSRLGTEIRDRQGLTYGIYSYFAAGKYPGPFMIQMQTSAEDTPAAIASTLSLLRQLVEQGISEAELSAAKRTLINSYPVELASLDTVARAILGNEVYGLAIAEIRQFPEHIEAVTLADVERAIQELIHPQNIAVVTAGPAVSNPIAGVPSV